MAMIIEIVGAVLDFIAVLAAFAILMFGVCGILYALASFVHDLMDCEDDDECD